MPQFILNRPAKRVKFDELSEFAKGYVEAMFFTGCDAGIDEVREDNLSVTRLTRESLANIARDCATFESENAELLALAYATGYTEEQAGRDFWFTRQGHGVGFWEREELQENHQKLHVELGSPRIGDPAWPEYERRRDAEPSIGDALTEAAQKAGESYVEIHLGWIYVR
jgi:hypothetical protein